MRLNSIALKNSGMNLLLLLGSLLVSFLIVEFTLRTFYPKYEYAAESIYDRNTSRIWSRRANSYHIYRHPASGLPHSVYHNNLALRHHRNFNEDDIETAINVAFFGDSFVENLRLPIQYSLTEPLDYMLNLHQSFNVLNFGIDGYGTDQSFLHYLEFPYQRDLDYVFYIFCENDLRNVYENIIFSIDGSGKLIYKGSYTSSWWITFLSKLHTTYLLLDAKQRLFPEKIGINNRAIKDYFTAKAQAKRFNSPQARAIQESFVMRQENKDLDLPTYDEHLRNILLEDEFSIIDLFELFRNDLESSNRLTWHFKNDSHWNESGNQLAMVHLYQFLEKEASLSPLSKNDLKEELDAYYAAFPDGWMPDMWVKKVAVPPEKSAGIRAKYTAIEMMSK
jgi:hypothetical protein